MSPVYERPSKSPDSGSVNTIRPVVSEVDQVYQKGDSDRLRRHGATIPTNTEYTYAQWHLEAWYFADAENLRRDLGGRSLGHVDTSRPDEITRPKEHLKNLLRRDQIVYTARLSAEIAEQLDPHRIEGRSPSFRAFGLAVRNGLVPADS